MKTILILNDIMPILNSHKHFRKDLSLLDNTILFSKSNNWIFLIKKSSVDFVSQLNLNFIIFMATFSFTLNTF